MILLNATIANKSIPEKEIVSALGKVLSNSRDWDGVRRPKNSPTPCQDSHSTTENDIATTGETMFFVNENNQLEFVQSVSENNYDLDDSSKS